MNPQILEKLLNVSREMAENRDLDPLLKYAMQVALDLCDGEYGYLMLLNNDGTLAFPVKQDRDGNEPEKPASQISRTIFDQVIAQRKPTIIADASIDPDYRDADSVMALRLRSVMCIPLISRGEPLGAIYIENRSQRGLFSEDELKPVEYFASQAAVAIENAMLNTELEARVIERTTELNKTVEELEKRTAELTQTNTRLQKEIGERKRIQEELRKLAMTDSLTGVYNRRHFFVMGEQAFNQACRYQKDLAVLMVDADHFKRINDQSGHAVGDQALRNLAERLLQHVRSADILGRYGGEEFAVLMPETGLSAAQSIAERLRQDIEALPIDAGSEILPLTISVGVATLDHTLDQTIDDLVARADQAMYAAKQAGRNRVSTWLPKESKPKE